MPLFSPRRYQQAWLPMVRPNLGLRVLAWVERTIKGWLFGCRMCGNCILQETFFVCPMTCAKGLRNGPCGEASIEHCVVDKSRICSWILIYQRAERLGKLDKLLEINAPVDGNLAGHEVWLSLLNFWNKHKDRPRIFDFFVNRKKFQEKNAKILCDLRQPGWWQGDATYHPPLYKEPISSLEANLRSEPFITTGEIVSSKTNCQPEEISSKAELLKDFVVSVNYGDNPIASSRILCLAGCQIIQETVGLETVLQIQPRDRSRLLVEADVMGASALGIRNILCVGGNYFNNGFVPFAMPDQYDLDTVQLIWMLRRMRDEGKLLDGRELHERPQYFLGATSNPEAAPARYNVINAEKKINAGAQFIQTQMVFNYCLFTEWLEAMEQRNLLDKVYVLAGVRPFKTAEEIQSLVGANGHSIPEAFIKRMEAALEKDKNSNTGQYQKEEGFAITIETIEKLKNTPGVSGIHFEAGMLEDLVPRICQVTNLPKPGIRPLK